MFYLYINTFKLLQQLVPQASQWSAPVDRVAERTKAIAIHFPMSGARKLSHFVCNLYACGRQWKGAEAVTGGRWVSGEGKQGAAGERDRRGTGNSVCRTCRTSLGGSNRNSRQFPLMRCALCNFWPTIFHCNAFWPFLYFCLISFRFRIHIRIRNSCCFPCGTSRRAVCCASAFVAV